MPDYPFYAKNGLVANGTFIANSTALQLGSNVVANTSQLAVITSTSNVVINALGIFIGNSTVNATINATSSPGSGNANQNASYTWTNTHTFNGVVTLAANVTIQGTINASAAPVASQTLTDGATINWNIAQGQIATVTLGGNRTMAAPTNLVVGTYILHVIQDATGSRTLSWNSVFKWPQATAPVLSTTAGRRDIISFICDGTNLYGSFLPDVR